MKKLITVLLLSFVFLANAKAETTVPYHICEDWSWCMGTGPMASPTDVSDSLTQFAQEAKGHLVIELRQIEAYFAMTWGQGLSAEIEKNRSSNEKLRTSQINFLRDLVVQKSTAESLIQAQTESGPYAKLDTLSDMIDISAQYQVSGEVAAELLKKHEEEFQVYENKWNSIFSAKTDLIKRDPEEIDVTYLFPSSKIFSLEELKPGLALYKQIIEPSPLPQGRTESDRKKLEVQRKIRAGQMLLPQRIVLDNLVELAPSMDAGPALKLHEKMGAETDPDFIKDDKISRRALLDLLASYRFSNPNWALENAEKNSSGLLKRKLIMKALELENQRNQLHRLQARVMLQAQAQASRITARYGPILDELNHNFILSKLRNQ